MQLALFVVLALAAEVLGTVGGFGSSVFFVPIAQLFFPFRLVLGITATFHVASNTAKLVLFWRHTDWRLALTVGVPSVAFVIAGALLTQWVEPRLAQGILGGFLTGFSALSFVRPIEFHPSTAQAALGGGLAGFVAGLLGTGGAIRGAVLLAFGLTKEAFVATSAAIDFAVDLSRSVVYLLSGYVEIDSWPYVVALVGVAFVGSFVGKAILEKISPERFRTLVLALIGGIGVVLVVQSIRG